MANHTTSSDTLFGMWQRGELTDVEALRVLYDDLRLLDTAHRAITDQRNALRDQIVQIVAHAGGIVQLTGIARLAVVHHAPHATYDHAALDDLRVTLLASHLDLAARLTACRSLSPGSTELRITPDA